MGPRKGFLKKFLTEPVFCDLSVFLDLSSKNCRLELAKNYGTDFPKSLEYKKKLFQAPTTRSEGSRVKLVKKYTPQVPFSDPKCTYFWVFPTL